MSPPRIAKETEPHGEMKFSKTVLNTLWMAYQPFAGKIISVFILGLLGRILLLGNANVIGLWVDSLCTAPQICKAVPQFLQGWTSQDFILTLLGMGLTGFAFTLSFRVLFSRLSAKSISTFYDEVTLRTSRFPMSFFDQTPTGRIITRFSSDYGNVFRLFGGPLAEFLSIIFDLASMLLLITLASPYYLISVGLIVILNWLVFRANRDKLRSSRRALSSSRSPSIAHFAETTQGASIIRSFHRESVFQNRFNALDSYFLDQKMSTIKNIISFSFQMNALSALLLLVTGTMAHFMIKNGALSVGSIGVAFSFIVLSGNTIQMFFEWLSQFEEALIGVERLDKYLRAPLEPGNLLPSTATFKTQHSFASPEIEKLRESPLTLSRSAPVEVNDLWFRYSPSGPWVLKNLNFEIKPGEKIGVVGRTGSGKSSLVQALFYLYPIERGSIKIGGFFPTLEKDGVGVELTRYRNLISYISQDPILFQGSLRANLDMDLKATDPEIWQALDKVGLKAWLKSLGQNLEFRIEERGKNLSLGEKQLLCMARALLRKAPVVVMDEATSSVDPQSEDILVKATEEFFIDRTQIIIAHRLSTLKKCHRILWLNKGEIKKFGPTSEILPEFESQSLLDLT
ncbi:MAG: ATP-binding cassette domain-containing protein [Bdellovibrionota bacterium]